jgi:putative pyrroloquinoline-quinone binding quinoprotein
MRRDILAGLFVAAAAVGAGVMVTGSAAASSAATPAASAVSDWGQAGSNAAISNSNLGESTLTAATVAELGYLRSYTSSPLTAVCGGTATPVIAGGDVTADVNGYLVHFVAATGQVLWQRTSNDGYVTSVAISDGKVIVGYRPCGQVSEPDGHLAAYDVSTGTPLWDVDTVPNGGSDGYMANIEVSGDYVITEGNSATPGAVTVHNVSDGSLVWADDTSSCAYGPAAVVGQEVIFTKCTSSSSATPGAARMAGRALATGAYTWHRAGTWSVLRGDRSAATGSNLFAINPTGAVVDVSPATGKTKYALTGAGSVLAVDASQAYATCGPEDINGDQDSLCAYTLGSGKQVWSTTQTLLGYYSGTGLKPFAAEAGGAVYLNTGYILNAKTGSPLNSGTVEAGYGYSSPPSALAVGDGRLIIADPAGRIIDLYGLAGE